MKKGTLFLSLSFLISKILGLGRDLLLASSFGAGQHLGTGPQYNLDAYYAAFRLPDMLFNLLSYGVVSVAFIPLFLEITKRENREKAELFAGTVLKTLAIGISCISIVLAVAAPVILKFIVPGFSQDLFDVTVLLTRIMLITPVFFTISGVFSSIQNASQFFLGLSIAPIIYNLSIVGGILLFSKSFGVYGVAWGVVVGALLHMSVQLPGLLRNGFHFRFGSHPGQKKNLREMILLSLPRLAGMSVSQISLVIDTIIASTLAVGSISIINFANNIEGLPLGMIGVTVSIVSFTALSQAHILGNKALFREEIQKSLERVLLLLLPISAGIIILAKPLVSVLLGYGAFTAVDVTQTATTLIAFSIGLSTGGIVFILARAFYAVKDTITPVCVGIAAVVTNIILSLVMTRVFHFATTGLALSNSAADFINASLLFIILSKKIRHVLVSGTEFLKMICGMIVMSGILIWVKGLIPQDTRPLVVLLVMGITGFFVYAAVLHCAQSKTLQGILDDIKKRLTRVPLN